VVVLPGGGYAEHVAHECEPIVEWLNGVGVAASVYRYPLRVRHPKPLLALRGEIRRLKDGGAERIGLVGFSAGGHLAGLAALAPGAELGETVDFAVLGYAITSMETDTYRPARLILLGEDATPELRRATSLDRLATRSSPPFFLWHTAEDIYVPPEHTYRLAGSLAAHGVPHTAHVFAHGPHSLGLARGSGDAAVWTTLAAGWIVEQSGAGTASASSSEQRTHPAIGRSGSARVQTLRPTADRDLVARGAELREPPGGAGMPRTDHHQDVATPCNEHVEHLGEDE
jgi:acetyl esterase/lipase